MRRFPIALSVAALLAACSVPEEDSRVPLQDGEVFHATFEQPCESGVRVYANEDLHLRWTADDRVSIFNKNTVNQQFRFTGETGDAEGDFIQVDGTGNESGEKTTHVISVYPYQETTSLSPDEVLSFSFPAEQAYADHSFGPGANTMVSVSQDHSLQFKNAGGYLALKLYGTDVSVSSIDLQGNNGEKLAGPCTVRLSEGLPVVEMDSANATDRVRLSCTDPVALGATADEYTEFWFVLPPVRFSEGFTITVTTSDARVFTRSTAKDIRILRSTLERMAPLKVVPKGIGIQGISPAAKNVNYRTDYDEDTRTFTMTIPTVTDFSSLVLNFDFEGEKLTADGQEIESGVTPIDASKDVTLTVSKGDKQESYTLKARNTGLPVVRITTQGFTLEDIENDEKHETWRPADSETESASIRIENPDGTVDCEVALQIRGRGNVSWLYPKRPYALKFAKKKEVLKMKKHKRWVLLANWKDRTLLRNDAAFWLSRHTGLAYTVNGRFVELEINGQHRGNYYLCEQIKVDENRVNITGMADGETGETDPRAITGGYLMEIDSKWDEQYKFLSTSPFNLRYQFKDPDENLSDAAFNYMKDYITRLETLIKNARTGEYRDYLDIDSAIWFLLVNEMTNNSDFFNHEQMPSSDIYGPHSTYLYKDRDQEDGTVSKLFMGPVWDFDYHVFVPDYSNMWAGADRRDYYYSYLYRDEQFRQRMLALWNDNKETFLGLTDYIREMADYIRLSEPFNTEMWWGKYGAQGQSQNKEKDMTFEQALDHIQEGFLSKWSFIDNNIDKLK